MAKLKQIFVAAGTFSVALGIGFVMQNSDALAARFNGDVPVDDVAMGLPDTALASAVGDGPQPWLPPTQEVSVADLDLPGFSVAPALPSAPVLLAALDIDMPLSDAVTSPMSDALAGVSSPQDCTISLSAQAQPAAMVALSLLAPCAPASRVVFHHQGMMFSMLSDAEGRIEVAVPALAETGVFLADIGEQGSAAAVVTVPDLALYERAVLQWEDGAGVQIHALEFGAQYGARGHVWAGAPRDASAATEGRGGFLVALGGNVGQTAYLAEIYTYPVGVSQRDGTVMLNVEAEIGLANCGQEVAAQTIQISPGSAPVAVDLTMSLPGCDAKGEILLLSNMLEDLTLASR